MNEPRLLDRESTLEERVQERSVRPKRLEDFVGQPEFCEQLGLYIEAARRREGALDHVLVYGPPGLGKTTLSHIVAHEMEGQLRQSSGPVLERSGDLAAIMTSLQPGDVLFIDEIHRMQPAVEEILYPALEDRQIDLMIGEGAAARSIQIDLPEFTLVGATTRAGLLTAPLLSRFGITGRLNFYTPEELAQIVLRSAGILGITIDTDGAEEIGRRSRGTPRIANRLLRRVRDYVEVRADGKISADLARQALEFMNVDRCGIDELDREYLRTIVTKFRGGPVGIDNIAAAINEERGTLEDVVEPYLIQSGFLMRTPRGRVATDSAREHLKVPASETGELPLSVDSDGK